MLPPVPGSVGARRGSMPNQAPPGIAPDLHLLARSASSAMVSVVPNTDPPICPHCGAPLGSQPAATPIENYWFLGRRHGPMKRFVEAGLTDQDIRIAMEAGVDAPDAIIAYCRDSNRPCAGTEGHP